MRPIPELARLARVLVGDWDTHESMMRSDVFPQGGERRGSSRWRLATEGTTLVGEGHSNGSAGPLSYLITIWWDGDTRLYYLLTCFKDAQGASCRIRGTAHWESDAFVNDYHEVERGIRVAWRDSFVELLPDSHKLVAARDDGHGAMQPLIVSTATRKRH